jgi:hypothetical protein
LVVPRSIPITFAIYNLSFRQTAQARKRHPASRELLASVPKQIWRARRLNRRRSAVI